MIRVYDEAGNLIETHEHKGDFKEPCVIPTDRRALITGHLGIRVMAEAGESVAAWA
jgi:hypothetical protein